MPEFIVGKIESVIKKLRQAPNDIVEFTYSLQIDSKEYEFLASCFIEVDEGSAEQRIIVDIKDFGCEKETIHFLKGILETSVVGIMSFVAIRDQESKSSIDFEWRTTNEIGAKLSIEKY